MSRLASRPLHTNLPSQSSPTCSGRVRDHLKRLIVRGLRVPDVPARLWFDLTPSLNKSFRQGKKLHQPLRPRQVWRRARWKDGYARAEDYVAGQDWRGALLNSWRAGVGIKERL